MKIDVIDNELARHYLAIRESKNDAIITSDKTMNILSWNEGARNLFGYTEEEILGSPISIIVPERFKKLHDQGMEGIINGNEPRVIGNAVELSGLHKDGHEFPIELTLGHWVNGEEMYFSGIIRDITRRRKNELLIAEQAAQLKKEKQELEIENQRFITISQSEQDAIITSDENKFIHSWNKGAENIFGYQRDDVIGKPIHTIIPERYKKMHEDGMDRVIKGGLPKVTGKTVELSGLHKTGHEFPIELTLGSWQAGDHRYFSGIIRDISDRKQAEKIIQEEKQKAENLLQNILPLEAIDELKQHGFVQSKYFSNVSILFTDIVGFTKISEELEVEKLVSGLNNMFKHFDRIIKRRGLEKIKTIGDAYMCAGGVPSSNKTHAIDCILAAIQILSYVKSNDNLLNCKIRLGIHTGPVMAGVVGDWKYTYDIWGDSVNIAARMESSGMAGKINISYATYNLVKDFFECEYRGKITAKNKGEIPMYKVRKIKKELSVDGSGTQPGQLFYEKYNKLKT